jgi:hypothetical protein
MEGVEEAALPVVQCAHCQSTGACVCFEADFVVDPEEDYDRARLFAETAGLNSVRVGAMLAVMHTVETGGESILEGWTEDLLRVAYADLRDYYRTKAALKAMLEPKEPEDDWTGPEHE